MKEQRSEGKGARRKEPTRIIFLLLGGEEVAKGLTGLSFSGA